MRALNPHCRKNHMSKFLDKHPRLKEAFAKNPAVAEKVEGVLGKYPQVDAALDGAADEINAKGLSDLAKESGKEAGVAGIVAVVTGGAVLPAAAGAVASYVAFKGAKGAYKALKNKPKPPQ